MNRSSIFRLIVLALVVSAALTEAVARSADAQRDARYIVTATPLALVGPGHPGVCLAIDPADAQGVWWWEPGPSGCATRTTGPAVFPAHRAAVGVTGAGNADIRFELQLMSGTRDVRLRLEDGAIRVMPSGARVQTKRRNDLNIPPAHGG